MAKTITVPTRTGNITDISHTRISTTALPFGDDSYECFVGKGSCRKCGCIAYGKRRCERCHRKFCSLCAPESLQKYGERLWEECCIGCEPYLVVAPAESEPILELEPESEEVMLFDKNGMAVSGLTNGTTRRLIHVPLSATIDITTPAAVNATAPRSTITGSKSGLRFAEKSSPTSSATLSTMVPSSSSDSDSHPDDESDENEEPPQEGIHRTTLSKVYSFNNSHHHISSNGSDGKGCCASCSQYTKGKRPCPSCGMKYCRDQVCMSQLYPNGTCVACSTLETDKGCTSDVHATTTSTTTPQISSKPTSRQYHDVHDPYDGDVDVDAPRTPISTRKSGMTNDRFLDFENGIECPLTPDAGCCTACQQFATGKLPCPSCGTKYCHELTCLAYLYRDETCVKCRAAPREYTNPPSATTPLDTGCCNGCQLYAKGKEPCETCGRKYCQEPACLEYLLSDGTCMVCHGQTSSQCWLEEK